MPLERKKRTEDFLRKCGIPVNESLPPIISENEADIKSGWKIIRRAVTSFLASMIALRITGGKSAGRTASLFLQYLEAFGLEDEATADEKKLFDMGKKFLPLKPDKEFLGEMTMRIERTMPLFWSCGMLDGDLKYPSGISNDAANRVSGIISKCECFEQVMSAVTMHSLSEMLDNADQAYRMYSACTEAIAKGEEPPANLAAEVLEEQCKGFNWMLGDYDKDGWDGIDEKMRGTG